MNAKHTPGEWKVRFMAGRNDSECDFFVEAPKTNPKMAYNIEIMQQDFGEESGYPREQKLADAYLIAAAPDLLNCCKQLMEWEEKGFAAPMSVSQILDRMKVAVAKATQSLSE